MKKKKLSYRIALLIAEFFYCGRFPWAPGTMGSLGALVIWVPLLYCATPGWLHLLLLGVLFFLGLWASSYGIKHYQKPDPKEVVIDEVVGLGLTFLAIGPHIVEIIIAFVLFRFFDIVKPWPIKAVEKRFPDKWGIMLDDVVAGLFSMATIYLGKLVMKSFIA